VPVDIEPPKPEAPPVEAADSPDAAERAMKPARPLDDLKAIIEALVFASPDPVTPKTLFKLLDSEPQEDVVAALAALKADYEHRGGLQLVEIAGGFQIVTRTELHEWVRRLFHERSRRSRSSLTSSP
jgi:chromosome segregation and condensation protein ScpB